MWKPFTPRRIDRGLKACALHKIATWQFDHVFFLSLFAVKTYCKSGAQNDHIIFLIHVVSAPLPSLFEPEK